MLTAETKRKIDAARQVLVGKVPDPKSQVQEITNALIYKFMDDMDERSVSMGGKRKYFSGEYEKYSWRAIMNPKVGAHERIGLYTEALSRLSKNPNLPELFRGIFRNAYLPFNDGRTLTLFLKEIDYFDYQNSEELGNAYEYLLSIMGSQGDAGQFRTPRHIIDFMVKAINPTKDDSVLDPACGTAGFLISAYKHVMSQHDDGDSGNKPLSADEKQKLHQNYRGFDIDDNMVKMSQVNMYLHGFAEPNIVVHDTLSSEDYWDERYDVIFANPPFMTPKGGIVPHNKFSIQSNRAEVLFVDYIVNHLKPSGRAGIIVPEGIIFQSGNAHKQLRKNLVEDGLYAVVSLPSGVFNPYAGVKTSILLFDNNLAKTADEMLFIKIENDGFDLGAQRRAIKNNDLPEALELLELWREGKKSESKLALYVKKIKIKGSDDYNLTSNRYRVAKDFSNAKWPMVKLEEVVEFLGKGGRPASFTDKKGNIPFITSSLEKRKCSHADYEMEALIVGDGGSANVHYLNGRFSASDHAYILKNKDKKTSLKYLYGQLINNLHLLEAGFKGQGLKNISKKHIKSIKIPLPPLEVQERIVEELDRYQKVIDGARQIVDNWKPKIEIDPEWEKVKFDEVCTLEYGKGLPVRKRKKGEYPVMGSNGRCGLHDEYLIEGPSIIVGRKGSAGVVVWEEKNNFPIDTTYYVKLVSKDKTNLKFIYYILLSFKMNNIRGGAGVPGLNRNDVYSKYMIPIPPLEVQKQIITKIEAERELIESTKKLIEIHEQKIQQVVDKLWEE